MHKTAKKNMTKSTRLNVYTASIQKNHNIIFMFLKGCIKLI